MSAVEILGQTVALPDLCSIAALAGDYRRISLDVADSKGRIDALRTHSGWQIWTGGAADAFTATLGTLPGQLDQAWQSFNTVAEALSSYASGVDAVLSGIYRLKIDADVAEEHLSSAKRMRDELIALGQDPISTGWDARVEDARVTVSALSGNLSSLLDELSQLSDQCVSRVLQAQQEGIQNNLFTWFERYIVDDVIRPLLAIDLGLATFAVAVLYDAFIKPLIELPGDVIQVIEHPSFHTLGIALGDIGSVLGLVAVITAAVLPGTDVVAIPVAAEYLRGIAIGADAASLGSNTAAKLLHEPGATWGDVGQSALALGADGAGRVFEDGSVERFSATGLGTPIVATGTGQLGNLGATFHSAAIALPIGPVQGGGTTPGLLPAGAIGAADFMRDGASSMATGWTERLVAFG